MAEISDQVISSITSLTEEFNIITHNLANVSTAGYKRRCGSFSSILDAAKQQSQSSHTTELDSLLDFTQGSMVETKRNMDFALYGNGFFVIETPDGRLYTRNGTFHLNQNGQIVDSQGRIVSGQSGAISIPKTVALSELTVSDDGTIRAGQTTVGKFRLVDFGDGQNKLEQAGLNCFYMPDKEITPADTQDIIVKQGFVESSNVEIIEELTKMIMVSRLYEANMKVVAASSEASKSILSAAMG